jgi:hypothetical protein
MTRKLRLPPETVIKRRNFGEIKEYCGTGLNEKPRIKQETYRKKDMRLTAKSILYV